MRTSGLSAGDKWRKYNVLFCFRFCFFYFNGGKENEGKGEKAQCSNEVKENTLKVVIDSGRWADRCLLTAAVVLELVFARLSIPGCASGKTGTAQHHVSAPSQLRDEIATVSHTVLITCKEMIFPRKAAQTINTLT